MTALSYSWSGTLPNIYQDQDTPYLKQSHLNLFEDPEKREGQRDAAEEDRQGPEERLHDAASPGVLVIISLPWDNDGGALTCLYPLGNIHYLKVSSSHNTLISKAQ